MAVRIEYIPPDRATMHNIARQVCQEMAGLKEDEGYTSKPVVDGLANHLNIVARIEASYLTSLGAVDNGAN